MGKFVKSPFFFIDIKINITKNSAGKWQGKILEIIIQFFTFKISKVHVNDKRNRIEIAI
jgi:hypothetical protein